MAERALVLGGGGSMGFAWQCGLLAGFAQAGVDLGQADFILGTSAGAMSGARLALGQPAAGLADRLLEGPVFPPDGMSDGPALDVTRLYNLLQATHEGVGDPAAARRELGQFAAAASMASEGALSSLVGAALGLDAPPTWPERRFACTAVDTEDGGFQFWDTASGVEMMTAVASSCALPGFFPPVSLAGGRYMDGGARSFTNADLAVGYDLIVVVAVQTPFGPRFSGRKLDEEVEGLKQAGAVVVEIRPDDASSYALGFNLMDLTRTPAAARAGLEQAQRQAEVLAPLWGGVG